MPCEAGRGPTQHAACCTSASAVQNQWASRAALRAASPPGVPPPSPAPGLLYCLPAPLGSSCSRPRHERSACPPPLSLLSCRSCASSWRRRAAWPPARPGSSCSPRGARCWRASAACRASSSVRRPQEGGALVAALLPRRTRCCCCCCCVSSGHDACSCGVDTRRGRRGTDTGSELLPNALHATPPSALLPAAPQAPTPASPPPWRPSRTRATRATCCAASASWASACGRSTRRRRCWERRRHGCG